MAERRQSVVKGQNHNSSHASLSKEFDLLGFTDQWPGNIVGSNDGVGVAIKGNDGGLE
jgi:hypothetical protein